MPLPLPRKKTFSKFPGQSAFASCGSEAKKCTTPGPLVAGLAKGPSRTSLTARELAAKLPPRQRGSRAMRRSSIRFTFPTSWQFFLLDAPEIRRAFLFERRVLIVRAARALVDSGACSLNAAAKIFGLGASTLCVLIQRHKSGGDESLLPRFGTHGPSTACRLSFLVRTQ